MRSADITDEVNTLYIGGGTPSVLPLYVFSQLLETLRSCGHGGQYEEFTVEVNPEDVVEKGQEYVEGLLSLGVNRISMGVQSFDDGILRWMNRRHDSLTARRAYKILEDAGVRNISIDLIFGMPQLDNDKWRDTLSKALDISSRGVLPQHISSYQLSIEPGSALAKLVADAKWSEASDDLCSSQYDILCETLSSAGYNHYEISNFARPGFEARHNSAYWSHVPYAGFGPGAHSYIINAESVNDPCDSAMKIRQWNAPDLHAYLDAARTSDFHKIRESEVLTHEQHALEYMMLGLRTSTGVEYSLLESLCSRDGLLNALTSGHLISLPSGRIRIPESHFFISDSILSAIV